MKLLNYEFLHFNYAHLCFFHRKCYNPTQWHTLLVREPHSKSSVYRVKLLSFPTVTSFSSKHMPDFLKAK